LPPYPRLILIRHQPSALCSFSPVTGTGELRCTNRRQRRKRRIRRACLVFARWRCERRICTLLGRHFCPPIHTDASMRFPLAVRRRDLRHFSCSAGAVSAIRNLSEAGRRVSRRKPQLSYLRQLAVDRCTPLSSPTFRAGLKSTVHHPFRRYSAYSAVTTPEVGSDVYDRVYARRRTSLIASRDRLTCIRAFGAVAPHTRTPLLASLSIRYIGYRWL